jgi:hypothetical protein
MLLFLLSALLVEAITEVLTKSQIFLPARKKIKSLSKWLGKLINCGYCTSFWVALFVILATQRYFPLSGNQPLDILLSVFLVQRTSNFIHNINDKFFDKYYDTRYINSEKEE